MLWKYKTLRFEHDAERRKVISYQGFVLKNEPNLLQLKTNYSNLIQPSLALPDPH